MKCAGCGTEYEGNFCPNCGTPVPQKVVCPWCGTEYIGKFCTNCGREPQEPMALRCQHLKDKAGNKIDVNRIAGVYLSVEELQGYFQRCTNYSEHVIEELSKYIYHNVDGNDYGPLASLSEKRKIEAEAKPPSYMKHPASLGNASTYYTPAPAPARTQREEQPKPQTKRERIRENKRNAVACCPKCGSTSLSANKKGFGVVKGGIGALAAGALTGGVGTVIGLGAGNLGAKKVWVTCLNCGHRWKL